MYVQSWYKALSMHVLINEPYTHRVCDTLAHCKGLNPLQDVHGSLAAWQQAYRASRRHYFGIGTSSYCTSI
jgi:hypothetical protein